MTLRLDQLRLRLAAHWRLKMVATPVFSAAFFAAYFQLLRHPVFHVTLMPLGALDRLVGFHPTAMLPYLSLWLYVFMVPALLHARREILAYSAAVATLTVVGLGAFFFWPTAVPPPDIDWTRHPAFAFLNHVDATGNACPSLHVAFTVLTAIWLERLLRKMAAPGGLRLLNVAWAAAIAYSTLATKQHVTVDVLAGAGLGLAGSISTVVFREHISSVC